MRFPSTHSCLHTLPLNLIHITTYIFTHERTTANTIIYEYISLKICNPIQVGVHSTANTHKVTQSNRHTYTCLETASPPKRASVLSVKLPTSFLQRMNRNRFLPSLYTLHASPTYEAIATFNVCVCTRCVVRGSSSTCKQIGMCTHALKIFSFWNLEFFRCLQCTLMSSSKGVKAKIRIKLNFFLLVKICANNCSLIKYEIFVGNLQLYLEVDEFSKVIQLTRNKS